MREEHVDGGYLVTQGVYTGTEDFNKAIVRQLMVTLCAPLGRSDDTDVYAFNRLNADLRRSGGV
jgi:hypothetical protein